MREKATKSERFELLLDPKTRELVRRMAELEGESQAVVVRQAIRERARRRDGRSFGPYPVIPTGA